MIFRGSIPHPMQSLCTLRNHCRQWPRNTRYQADATPYLGRTFTGWIAPALRLAHLFNHLVGAGEHGCWNVYAERLCSFEVDYQLVFGRRLHRKVGGLLAFENAINIAGGAAELIDIVGAVGYQPAAGDVEAGGINGGQSEPRRQGNYQVTVDRCSRTFGFN